MVEEDVGSLDITVNFFSGVKIIKALENGLNDGGDFPLIELFFGDLHDVGDASGHTIFHYDP